MHPAWSSGSSPARRLRTIALAAMFAFAALALAGAPAGAQSGHVAMRWNDCFGDGGTRVRTFACDTNSGSEMLVVSAFPPVDMPQLNGASLVIDVLTSGETLPSWWQFQTGGCRTGSGMLSVQFTPPPTAATCTDTWLSSAAGGMDFSYPWAFPGGARVRVVVGIPGSVPVLAGTEVFICRVRVSHAKTVGTGACSGCTGGLCIGLTSVVLTQPSGVGDQLLFDPLPGTASDATSWQTDMVMTSVIHPGHGGFGLVKDFTSCVAATDAARPTWGAIKRMYR